MHFCALLGIIFFLFQYFVVLAWCTAVDVKPLPETVNSGQTDDNQQVFIAFARVFSGVVRRGQTLYVLGPKHDPCKVLDSVSLLCVSRLLLTDVFNTVYLWMTFKLMTNISSLQWTLCNIVRSFNSFENI